MKDSRFTQLQKGFTLVELLTIVFIIALLAAIVYISFNPAREQANYSSAIKQMREIDTAIQSLKQDTGKWPFGCPVDLTGSVPQGDTSNKPPLGTKESGLFAIPQKSELWTANSKPMLHYADGKDAWTLDAGACAWTEQDIARWHGPYIGEDNLKDPWGGDYQFARNNTGIFNSRTITDPVTGVTSPDPYANKMYYIFTYGFQQPPDCWGENGKSFTSNGILALSIIDHNFSSYKIVKSPRVKTVPANPSTGFPGC